MEDKIVYRKCPICGKRFIVYNMEQYQWKFNCKAYCSYKCMRVHEKEYCDRCKEKMKNEMI